MELENNIINDIAPAIRTRGYLTIKDLLIFSKWKSGNRTKHLVSKNSKHKYYVKEDFVKKITSASLESSNERFRIEVLTLLDGVSWPTASIILHICTNEPYPVLDFRALWSLNFVNSVKYNFDFWWEYTLFCRMMS